MIAAFALAALLSQTYYSQKEAQELFSQANEAYYKEDYAAARQGFLRLLQHGYGGPDVLYNLGTTALAQGSLGEAVLYLERARREGGADPDVDAHLDLARSRQLDAVVGPHLEDTFVQRLVASTDGNLFGVAFMTCWLLAFVFLGLFRLWTPGRRAWAAALAGLMFIAAVPTGAVLAAHVHVRANVREAVVLARTLGAREFPREAAKISFEVHEGLKVRLLETSGKFVKIRLPNGLQGWAEKDGVGAI